MKAPQDKKKKKRKSDSGSGKGGGKGSGKGGNQYHETRMDADASFLRRKLNSMGKGCKAAFSLVERFDIEPFPDSSAK